MIFMKSGFFLICPLMQRKFMIHIVFNVWGRASTFLSVLSIYNNINQTWITNQIERVMSVWKKGKNHLLLLILFWSDTIICKGLVSALRLRPEVDFRTGVFGWIPNSRFLADCPTFRYCFCKPMIEFRWV